VTDRLRSLWPRLSQNLAFVPGVIVAVFAVLGIVLVQVDGHVDLDGSEFVFKGDGSAARTVLSVIAGSLITVAGLTFSITMVVLQLTSTQFSPRMLRTFFGDRWTQITIGAYVGIFVYSILVLRAVGSPDTTQFVPRLSVTLASLFGIAAVILLVFFLHHISQMIQVSHASANVARQTLARADALYPNAFAAGTAEDDFDSLLESWRHEPSGRVMPTRPGFIQQITLEKLACDLGSEADRVALLVCPGDFVSVDLPLAEIWPQSSTEGCREPLLDAITLASERDLNQDVDFGLRQLTDTAIKAMSPAINDPMTAVTCVGYIRSILVRLTEREAPPVKITSPTGGPELLVRRRAYHEYLESLVQLDRYVEGDAWVIGSVLDTLEACLRTALAEEAPERAAVARSLGLEMARQAAERVHRDRDREAIATRLARFEGASS
jgi:uncharacterized membrane protein